jgi:hypothetical protein
VSITDSIFFIHLSNFTRMFINVVRDDKGHQGCQSQRCDAAQRAANAAEWALKQPFKPIRGRTCSRMECRKFVNWFAMLRAQLSRMWFLGTLAKRQRSMQCGLSICCPIVRKRDPDSSAFWRLLLPSSEKGTPLPWSNMPLR